MLNDEDADINKKLKNLLLVLTEINLKVDKISKETERMNNHITFIEEIYIKVKSPFHYVMNKISSHQTKE